MLYPLKGKRPQIGEGAYVAPGARVIGDVVLGQGAGIWFNCVVRGDTETITIGDGTNIQDLTMVHADPGFPATIGRNVTVGHTCIIHGCSIGDNVLIGMGSTILNGAKIGENSLVGAGSLVTEGKEFPPGSVIMGRPAKVVRAATDEDIERIRHGAETYKRNASLFLAEHVQE